MKGKKIRLDVDDLAVESFAVTEPHETRGTVVGHETEAGTCNDSNCARTCTDMTDCWGVCGGASEYCTVGCESEYTWHVSTCAYYVTCPGYRDITCNDSCDPYANTCAMYCGTA